VENAFNKTWVDKDANELPDEGTFARNVGVLFVFFGTLWTYSLMNKILIWTSLDKHFTTA
jgi:hypothetical protein